MYLMTLFMWVPFYKRICAKCKVTQSFSILITFKPLITSKKGKYIIQ